MKKTKSDYFKKRVDRVSEEIEESYGRKLTNRQKEFAAHYVDGTHSNAECARLAGYSDKDGKARNRAYAKKKKTERQGIGTLEEFLG